MCIDFDSMRINESSCKCRLQTILTYQSAQNVFKGLLFPWLTSIALALIVHLYRDCRHIWYDSLVEYGWFWFGLHNGKCQQVNANNSMNAMMIRNHTRNFISADIEIAWNIQWLPWRNEDDEENSTRIVNEHYNKKNCVNDDGDAHKWMNMSCNMNCQLNYENRRQSTVLCAFSLERVIYEYISKIHLLNVHVQHGPLWLLLSWPVMLSSWLDIHTHTYVCSVHYRIDAYAF